MTTIIVYCSFLEYTTALEKAHNEKIIAEIPINFAGRRYSLSVLKIKDEMQKMVPRREWRFIDPSTDEESAMERETFVP